MNLKDRLRMLKAAGAARNERPPEPVEEFSPPIGSRGPAAEPEPGRYTADDAERSLGEVTTALAGGTIE
ncbi:MAG TPA: hypothetical protein VD973_29545, partial [Symbiobacteriaceae bacterium]|nr:hypothetical protein [Symbiobacteriaceae bacterium]